MDLYLTEPIGPFHVGARSTNTFTTKQDVSPAPMPVIPGSKLRPGSKVYAYAQGDVTTTGTPTLVLGFWIGTRQGVITADLAVSAALSIASAAAWPWKVEWEGICTGVGTTGSLLGQGQVQVGSSLTAFVAETPIPLTAALRTVSIDTTIERAIGVSATFSASSASNQVTVNTHRVMIFN